MPKKRKVHGIDPELLDQLEALGEEDFNMVTDGLHRANWVEPQMHCAILSEYYNRETRCSEPHDCGSCTIFQWKFPVAHWLCSECTEEGLVPEGAETENLFMIGGHYQEGACDCCGKQSFFLVPIVEDTDDPI